MIAQQKPINAKLRHKLLTLINKIGFATLNKSLLSTQVNSALLNRILELHIADLNTDTVIEQTYTNIRQFYSRHGINLNLTRDNLVKLIGLRAGLYASLKNIKQKIIVDDTYGKIQVKTDSTLSSYIKSNFNVKDYNIGFTLLYLDYLPDDMLSLLLDGLDLLVRTDIYDSDFNLAAITIIIYLGVISYAIVKMYNRLVRNSPMYATILYLTLMTRYYPILLEFNANSKAILSKISDNEIASVTLQKYKVTKANYIRYLQQPTKVYPANL